MGGSPNWGKPKPSPAANDSTHPSLGSEEDFCDIVDEGILRSPDPDVVAKLSIGAALSIETAKVKTVSVLVAKWNDARIGVVDCQLSEEIISCIVGGYRFRAVITKLRAGIVAVSISRTT